MKTPDPHDPAERLRVQSPTRESPDSCIQRGVLIPGQLGVPAAGLWPRGGGRRASWAEGSLEEAGEGWLIGADRLDMIVPDAGDARLFGLPDELNDWVVCIEVCIKLGNMKRLVSANIRLYLEYPKVGIQDGWLIVRAPCIYVFSESLHMLLDLVMYKWSSKFWFCMRTRLPRIVRPTVFKNTNLSVKGLHHLMKMKSHRTLGRKRSRRFISLAGKHETRMTTEKGHIIGETIRPAIPGNGRPKYTPSNAYGRSFIASSCGGTDGRRSLNLRSGPANRDYDDGRSWDALSQSSLRAVRVNVRILPETTDSRRIPQPETHQDIGRETIPTDIGDKIKPAQPASTDIVLSVCFFVRITTLMEFTLVPCRKSYDSSSRKGVGGGRGGVIFGTRRKATKVRTG
ncbi:hypothetical protein FPV67DRAFT_1659182 [Lyophyllum atratum]|nr:hypothetical protein FPV67DRAFT_1659182 [Lyophyllum atratum]